MRTAGASAGHGVRSTPRSEAAPQQPPPPLHLTPPLSRGCLAKMCGHGSSIMSEQFSLAVLHYLNHPLVDGPLPSSSTSTTHTRTRTHAKKNTPLSVASHSAWNWMGGPGGPALDRLGTWEISFPPAPMLKLACASAAQTPFHDPCAFGCPMTFIWIVGLWIVAGVRSALEHRTPL